MDFFRPFGSTCPRMFSLQQLFGKGDKFFDLLEAAAQEAHESVRLTNELIKSPRDTQKLDDLVLARRKEKKISDQISEELVKTFVTGLEREDIEALSRTIYKIPKTAEKLAERFLLAAPHLAGRGIHPPGRDDDQGHRCRARRWSGISARWRTWNRSRS